MPNAIAAATILGKKPPEGRKSSDDQPVECYFWPMSLSGTIPDILLTDEEKAAISELMGENGLKCVIGTAEIFFLKRKYFGETTISELNEKLFQAGKHADALAEILKDRRFVAHLQNKIQGNLANSYKLAARQLDNPGYSHAKSSLLPDLAYIRYVAHIVKKQQSRTGRRKGQGKIAERFLVQELYRICHQNTGKRPTNNPKGTLQQLIKILNRPLELGGNLPGLVRQIIDEKTAEEQNWRDSTLK